MRHVTYYALGTLAIACATVSSILWEYAVRLSDRALRYDTQCHCYECRARKFAR